MKRLRWTAVLVGFLLAMSWSGVAQATSSDESTTTTTASDPGATTTTTPDPDPGPGGEPDLCSAVDGQGLKSHSGITVAADGSHPRASASFEVKEGCVVFVSLVSFVGSFDDAETAFTEGEFFDSDPEFPEEEPDPEELVFGPGRHDLTVDLPPCSPFTVTFVGIKIPEDPKGLKEGSPSEKELEATVDALSATTGDEEPPPDEEFDDIFQTLDLKNGETTNCGSGPTTTRPSGAPGTPSTEGPGELPFTGSNAVPMLLAGLILVVGGGAALLASRARGRRART